MVNASWVEFVEDENDQDLLGTASIAQNVSSFCEIKSCGEHHRIDVLAVSRELERTEDTRRTDCQELPCAAGRKHVMMYSMDYLL